MFTALTTATIYNYSMNSTVFRGFCILITLSGEWALVILKSLALGIHILCNSPFLSVAETVAWTEYSQSDKIYMVTWTWLQCLPLWTWLQCLPWENFFHAGFEEGTCHTDKLSMEIHVAKDHWGVPDHNQGETGCLNYFSIVVRKHNDQGNL